jgi:cytochrome P450
MTTSTVTYPPRPVVDRKELPPGPSELPVIGQTLRYIRDPIRFMQEAAGYGDLVTLSVKPALLLMVNHPDLIRDVVVTNHRLVGRGPNADVLKYAMGDGLVTAGPADHLQQRRLMQPQFHRGRIEGYGELMREYAAQHRTAWTDGQRVDMAQEMGTLTLRVVVKTLFGLELPDDVRRIGGSFELINSYLVARVNQPPKMRRLLHRLPVPYTVRFRRATTQLDRMIFGLIAERRATSTGEDDLLSLLLDARLEDDEGVGQPLTDQQVRDQTITMFAAGHETTAVCLTWTWYLLATNPQAQARFHAELDDVLGDRAPELGDLPKLNFMDQILTESLRLYPPIWFWSRMAFQPFELGGYQIPPGALLAAPQLVIQRDPRWFDQPLEFRPERWTEEFRSNLPRYAYYPFGGGPRQCIGEGFAMMEAKMILATLGQQWKVRHDARHKAEMLPLISLRPKGGMPMYLEQRAKK